ncbi:unnamed protein product, partial [Rotaria sp. Silwood1]
MVPVVDEESETDEVVDNSVLQKHQTNENVKKHRHSSSVIPKNNLRKSDSEYVIESDDDEDMACTGNTTTVVGLKETGCNNDKTLDEKNKYYCNYCAAGGWEKSVSLSQHMRHMHKAEYNASIEVPMTKRRWTQDEVLILAEFEAKIPSTDGIFINQILVKEFPTRSLESIKSRRKMKEYRMLVQQLRDCHASQIIEELECTDKSSVVNSNNITVVNDSIIVEEDENETNPDDRNITVTGTDSTTYPNVQQYVKEKIID